MGAVIMHTRTILGMFTAAVVWSSAPASAKADTYTNISFDALAVGEALDGRIFVPDALDENPAAIIMMHGCTGLWSDRDPANGVAQNHIEKWGRELAAQGYVVLAVDSYTTRTPEGLADPLAWQDQCSNGAYPGAVDPYTTRVDDIEAARQYLLDQYDVDADALGLLGWSQGAQSVLVAMAATPRTTNTAYSTPPAYAAATAFYPGCGPALGYGLKLSGSDGYWRPANPMRLHMGEDDTLHGNCERRVNNAWSVYGATPGTADALIWREYVDVGHSFDHVGGWTFPTSKCSPEELADAAKRTECAMRDADVDSLDFFLAEVVAG